MHSWVKTLPSNCYVQLMGNFLMHFALLFLEFRCHSRIAKLSDYRGETQCITLQEFRSLTICVQWRGWPIKGGPIDERMSGYFVIKQQTH